MLWTILVVLLILWLLGFSFHIAGSLIHILLVVAVVVLIYQPDQRPSNSLIFRRLRPHKFVHKIMWNEKEVF